MTGIGRLLILPVVIVLMILVFPLGLAAQSPKAVLDPEPTAAYRWQVGLRCGDHPVLSDDVRRQLARELRAALQATVEAAGDVEVVDFTGGADDKHPLFKAFAEKGWPALDPDSGRELTGIKTHVLTVDYRDGTFHLAAKQLDGFTGIASPVLRKQTTRSADLLGRVASLLVEPDFGPVGTAVPIPGEDAFVKVTFRGWQVASPDRWVKRGDVLLVSAVRDVLKPVDPKAANARGQLPTVRTGVPFVYTLLKVAEKVDETGSCKCVILTRFKDPFALDVLGRNARRRVGLRVMKLATVEAKVRLRLVGQDGQPHAKGSLLQVAGTDLDFSAAPGPNDVLKYAGGVYQSGRVFNNIACIQVGVEGGVPQQFPVPVLGDDTVVLRFDVKPEDEERAVFARECSDYRSKVTELVQAQRALFEKVNKLLDLSKNHDALAEAQAGQARVVEAQKVLNDELKQLREKPRAGEENIKKVLDASEKQLAAVDKGQQDLDRTMGLLRDAVKASTKPALLEAEFRSKELAERIKEYVARGDVPEALETYEKLINLLPARQDLKDAREKLLAEWAPKDDEHRKARAAMKKWAAAKTVEEFNESALEMKVAIGVLARKKDKLGLRKLQNSYEPAYATLTKLLNDIDGTTEEGTKAIKDMKLLVELVKVIEDDTRIALKQLLDEKK